MITTAMNAHRFAHLIANSHANAVAAPLALATAVATNHQIYELAFRRSREAVQMRRRRQYRQAASTAPETWN
jgi:hypothetical protein